jgi:hypothetical protein
MWFTAGTGLTGEAVMTDWTEAGNTVRRQTPYRGHPVFVAQHATATCCRTCLERWHQIPKGSDLSRAKRAYVVDVICRWIEREMAGSSETRVDPGSPGA